MSHKTEREREREREREEDAVSLRRCSILMLYRFYPKLMQMVKKGVNGFGATIISVVQQLFL